MLQDEKLEYIKEQFDEKNMVLGQFGDQVNPWTFYEDVFGDMSLSLPVVILDEDTGKKIQPMELDDAIDFSMSRNDVLLGGVAYFNNWISKKSAKEIYTFIIDMDNVYSGTLLHALQADWKSANGEAFAKPTYIVNSGTGLHLYFVLEEPIPCYRRSLEDIDQVYRQLAIQQSRRVYVNRQVQWFGQDFRMAGGQNKYGWENAVYRIGDKWNIDELAKTVGIDTHFVRYGEPKGKIAQEKRKRQRRKVVGWKTNKAFYEHTLEGCREKTKEGHRYTSLCALTVIAWKCGVPIEQLEQDLLGLLPGYNKGAKRQIKESEVYSALKMYNDRAMQTQRKSLEHWQGWEFKPIKRNGRKQEEHLRRARLVQTIDFPDGEWRNKKGAPSAQTKVQQYRAEHPESTVAEVARALQISRTTVYKWWNGEPAENVKKTTVSKKAPAVQDPKSKENEFDWRATLAAATGVSVEDVEELLKTLKEKQTKTQEE